eukprot:11897874-Alexandrium_andersonii.AAC.1
MNREAPSFVPVSGANGAGGLNALCLMLPGRSPRRNRLLVVLGLPVGGRLSARTSANSNRA